MSLRASVSLMARMFLDRGSQAILSRGIRARLPADHLAKEKEIAPSVTQSWVRCQNLLVVQISHREATQTRPRSARR